MTSLWAIIRSEDVAPDLEYESDDPTICGIYSSKKEAVEEILKLYIEDDIDLKTSDVSETANITSLCPTVEEIKEQRRRLMEDEIYNTFTNLGNKYGLVNCKVGAKHVFQEDIMELYNKSK